MNFLRAIFRIFWPKKEPVFGFCKQCRRWTATKYIRVYRNRTRRVEAQPTCGICGRWRWG